MADESSHSNNVLSAYPSGPSVSKSSLLGLHDDALLNITEFLSNKTLACFSRTCHRINSLARPLLEDRELAERNQYKFLGLTHQRHPITIIHDITQQPRISQHIRSITCRWRDDWDQMQWLTVECSRSNRRRKLREFVAQHHDLIKDVISSFDFLEDGDKDKWYKDAAQGEYAVLHVILLKLCPCIDFVEYFIPDEDALTKFLITSTALPTHFPCQLRSITMRFPYANSTVSFTMSKLIIVLLIPTIRRVKVIAPSTEELSSDHCHQYIEGCVDPGKFPNDFVWPEHGSTTSNVECLEIHTPLLRPRNIADLFAGMPKLRHLKYTFVEHQVDWAALEHEVGHDLAEIEDYDESYRMEVQSLLGDTINERGLAVCIGSIDDEFSEFPTMPSLSIAPRGCWESGDPGSFDQFEKDYQIDWRA